MKYEQYVQLKQKCEPLIKQVYEGGKTFEIIALPQGATIGDVAAYIMLNYKKRGYPVRYDYCECYSTANIYHWENGFAARIDIWSGQITIWKE